MSLTKATYSMILGAPVNVKDFGAKGDGTTDDTAAIQAAISSVSSGILYFPVGSYKTTAKLTTTYGQNIKLQGSLVYGGVSINAYHTDHIFQYNYTVAIDGITFNRATAYVAGAISAQSYAIYSNDTGGAIAGAAYTYLSNCVAFGGYGGILMWGTDQMAVNCTANGNVIGFSLMGADHTLNDCTTEQNTQCGVYISGNGHRLYSHYADDNCSGAVAHNGAITINGSMNTIVGTHFNDNNAAAHYYFASNAAGSASQNTILGGEFYNTSPRVTLYAATGGYTVIQNKVDIQREVVVTVDATGTPTNCYQNYFNDLSSYATGTTYGSVGWNNLYSQGPLLESFSYIPSVNASASYEAFSGQLMPNGAQYFAFGAPIGSLSGAKIRILGVYLYANNVGTSQTVNASLIIRDVQNNNNLATLLTLTGNSQYGVSNSANSYSAGLADITTPQWNIYLLNNNATTISNVGIRIVYCYLSTGSYI